MDLLIPAVNQSLSSFPAHRVYARVKWSDEWTLLPYIYCNWCHFGCGAEPSRAELVWNYGSILQPGATEAAVFSPVNLLHHYVRIEIDQPPQDANGNALGPIVWYGIITEQGDRHSGSYYLRNNDAKVPTGSQTLVCHGLELLLERTYVTDSYYLVGQQEIRVRRALQFNLEHDYLDQTKTFDERKTKRFGNMSPELGPKGARLFAENLKTAKLWSSWDILGYLRNYHSPKDSNGQEKLTWWLTPRAIEMTPNWDSPVIKADGMSVKAILDQLFDRRRLLSWRVVVAPSGLINVDVFSFNTEPISLETVESDGHQQSPNTQTLALDYSWAVDVADASLQASATHSVHRVICRGARKRTCFTVSHADGTLEADWKPEDETAYETGPTDLPSDFMQKKLRLRNWRKEDRFKRVFSYFRVPKDWAFKAGNGAGAAVQNPVFPEDPETGPEEIYRPEATFQRHIFRDLMLAAPTDSPEDAQQPAAWIKLYNSGGQDRWQHVEHLSKQEMMWVDNMSRIDFNCSLRVQENGLGIVVKVNGSQFWEQEAIAKTDFSGVSGCDIHAPQLDWKDLIATVMLELDSRAYGAWPKKENFVGTGGDVARVLVLDFGDRFRLDYAPAGTVKGVSDGVLQRLENPAFFRDDRTKLQNLARVVYEWYAKERRALHLTLSRIVTPPEIGTIISTVARGDDNLVVGTPVTSVHFDLLQGSTTITTAFAELDPLHL